MSIGNLKDNGNKGNNFPYQLGVLQLLKQISDGISVIPGTDYETRTTTYQATAAGPGYSIGDIIVRYDIIDVATSTISATIWFNQTTQAAIAAPAPGNLTPMATPSSVTVNNGVLGAAVNIQDGGNSITIDNANLNAPLSTLNKEATQLLIQALLTAIDADTSNLDVALSTRASEATLSNINGILGNTLDVLLSTRASEATLLTRLSKADFEARINTLGQKTMALSTPMVIASNQSAIPVTLPVAVSRIPTVVNIPASSAGSTTAGVQELGIIVVGAGNTVGGVAVPNGTVLEYRAKNNDTVGAIAYTTGAGANRLILTYLT